MSVKLYCPVKINLTLRIFSQREDGYHEIYSLFWRKKAIEGLTIMPSNDENISDLLRVKGLDIKGPNIVLQTAEWARKNNPKLPWLEMELEKKYPDGSGIGAGSGNAAALINWLRKERYFEPDPSAVAKLGADVAFLAGKSDVASAEGIGEKLTPFAPLPEYRWIVAFPKWKSNTAKAYAALDRYREKIGYSGDNYPNDKFKREAAELHSKLTFGRQAGLLPNDFYNVLLSEHSEYREAEKISEGVGALAWGLCGSGSAFVAVCGNCEAAEELERKFNSLEWVNQTSKME